MRPLLLILSLLGAPLGRAQSPATCSLRGKVTFTSPDRRIATSELVVYVSAKPRKLKLSEPRRHEIAQLNKEFVPRTLIIQRADSVAFPNRDSKDHSVFSADRTTVRIPATSKAEPDPATFTKEGGFRMQCDIHSNMRAWVMVVPVRELATQVADDGTWRIDNVPAGPLTLKVAEPNGAVKEVSVSACASDTPVDTTLEGNEAPLLKRFNGSPYSEYQQ